MVVNYKITLGDSTALDTKKFLSGIESFVKYKRGHITLTQIHYDPCGISASGDKRIPVRLSTL